MDQFNHNSHKIINIQQNFNTLHLASFQCDGSGKMYPDPETQCQVIVFNANTYTHNDNLMISKEHNIIIIL